ncbi:prosaposin [Tanacetum coccineum]
MNGRMGGRIGLTFVFLLAASLACDARDLTITSKNEVSMVSVLRSHVEKRTGLLGKVGKNDDLCTLCEEYVSEALVYLQQNKTQQEIISALHESCSKLQSLKKQCIILVDYYAPLFFLELNTIKPAEFCGKVNLCQQVIAYAQEIKQNSCDVCNMAIEEVITLLKDPDNQLTILELLLKECKTVEKYLPKAIETLKLCCEASWTRVSLLCDMVRSSEYGVQSDCSSEDSIIDTVKEATQDSVHEPNSEREGSVDEGPNSEEEEEAVPEGQQHQAVKVVDTTIDAPLQLGYRAARHRALESIEEKTPKHRNAAQALGVERPCYYFRAVEET